MYFLLTQPEGISPARYARFLRRAQAAALFPDHMVAGEPYLALNGLVLSPGDAALLRRLTECFSHVCYKAARSLATDVSRLVDWGFPWAAAELLSAEAPQIPLAGRFDFLQDEAGRWWLLEFNADTPSGIREATVVDCLVHGAIGGTTVRPNAGLDRLLVEAFSARTAGGRVGLITDASELEDMAQMAFTQRLLQDAGVTAVLADVDNVQNRGGRLRLFGRAVNALYRYIPFEAMYGTAPFAAIYEAVLRGRLRLLNGLFGLLLQHKGLLAWIWEHCNDPLFTPDEQSAMRDHLPPTWRVDDIPAGVERTGLAVKQVFGREGEEVFFGDGLSSDAWAEFERRRTYVAQQRVLTAAITGVVPGPAGLEARKGYPTVGSFAIDGRWAGYYTRFGGPITTSRAKWVATFEEREADGV